MHLNLGNLSEDLTFVLEMVQVAFISVSELYSNPNRTSSILMHECLLQ